MGHTATWRGKVIAINAGGYVEENDEHIGGKKAEVAREYSFEMATGDPEEDDLAATVLDLYGKNFADESGDSSDEPAALLSMLRGSWALAVVGERAAPAGNGGGGNGGTGLHVIVARSANGKVGGGADEMEEEEEEEAEVDDDDDDDDDGEASAATAPSPPPLFWGLSESQECLLVSSTPQPGLSPFPAGCFYESSPASFSSAEEEGGSGGGEAKKKNALCRIDQFSRRFASKATREVLVAAAPVPSPRGGEGGIVRPLQYKTRSGKDLKVVE